MEAPVLTAFFRWFSADSLVSTKTEVLASISSSVEGRAIVTEVVQPGQRGRVWFEATEWFAVCPYYVVLIADTPVRVVGRNSTTLIIEPVPIVMPYFLSLRDAA